MDLNRKSTVLTRFQCPDLFEKLPDTIGNLIILRKDNTLKVLYYRKQEAGARQVTLKHEGDQLRIERRMYLPIQLQHPQVQVEDIVNVLSTMLH